MFFPDYKIKKYLLRTQWLYFVLVLVVFMVAPVNQAVAITDISKILSYQGRLTDANGNPSSGQFCFKFSIYTASSGGTKVWPVGAPSTMEATVSNGIFNLGIGDAVAGGDDLSNSNWNVSYPNGFADIDTTYLNIDVASRVGATCAPGDGAESFETLAPRQRLDATSYARVSYSVFGGDVQVGTGGGVTSGQKLLKLDVKSLAGSDVVGGSGCSPNGAMWYNSGLTPARTLVCDNGLYQAVGSSITNQYFGVSGPTVTGGVKTFAFPDASAMVLTSFTPVTIAQGGTGTTTAVNAFNALSPITTKGDLISRDTTNNIRLGVGTNGQVLIASSTATAGIAWATISGSTNALLDGASHTDTLAGTVAQGDVIVGNATPKWARLAKGTSNQVLSMDGTATNVLWVTPTSGGAPTTATYITQTADAGLSAEQALSALATGPLRNTTATGVLTVASTSLTSEVTGILPTANGGTGIAFFTATGPTVARTFTFPDANATVLTSAAAVTVAQGGTGLGTLTLNNLIYGNGTSNALLLAPGATTGAVLMNTAAGAPSWALLSGLPSTAGALPVANGGTGLATLTANNVLLGNGTTAPLFVAPGTAGNLLQSNGTTWQSAARFNYSTAAQVLTAATLTYITGSKVTVPVGKLRIGTMIRWTFDITKTAAGIAASTYNIRVGTLGTTGDAAIVTFTKPAGTAALDNGRIVIEAIVRGPLSASGVMVGHFHMTHNLAATGHAIIPVVDVTTVSGAFDVTAANLMVGLTATTGASDAITIQSVMTEIMNL